MFSLEDDDAPINQSSSECTGPLSATVKMYINTRKIIILFLLLSAKKKNIVRCSDSLAVTMAADTTARNHERNIYR